MSSTAVTGFAALALFASSSFADTCDLKFSVVSTAVTPSYFGSTSHEVWIINADTSKPSPTISKGCSWGYFGGGCTWQREGESEIEGYTVKHSVFQPFLSNRKDVWISGNGCDETHLYCQWRPEQKIGIEDPDGGPPQWLNIAQSDCALTRPAEADSTYTVGEIIEGYNAAQLVEIPLPADPSAMPMKQDAPPQIPPLSCTLNDATDCYDAHWLCTDGVESVAYPADEAIEPSMTMPPAAAPTFLANRCPDDSNPRATGDGLCSVEVGVAINRVENEKPLVALTMFAGDRAVGEPINREIDMGETQDTGGLGPIVYWTLKPNPLEYEWPVDLDFTYDVESWNWLGCEFMSQSNLGRDTMFESRKCTFPCHG